MTGNSDESFDFSNPLRNTVEVESKNVTNDDFAQRFEAAKVVRSETVQEVVTPVSESPKPVPVPQTQKINKFQQWAVTFVLLSSLCLVSAFAVINYKQYSITLADLQNQQQVAGVKNTDVNTILGPNFSIITRETVSKDFKLQILSNETLMGSPRSFQKSSYTVVKTQNGVTKVAGIEVLSQEVLSPLSDSEINALAIKNFDASIYTYPLVSFGSSQKLKLLALKNPGNASPTMYFGQTATQLYIIRQYEQIPEYEPGAIAIVKGIVLN